jgi:hypothetical protein
MIGVELEVCMRWSLQDLTIVLIEMGKEILEGLVVMVGKKRLSSWMSRRRS